jgi:uncharacterized cofD-like protein
MIDSKFVQQNKALIKALKKQNLAPMDLIPQHDIREKLVELVLNDSPSAANRESSIKFRELKQNLEQTRVDRTKVVVFGGGTGLSNIIGGDSRQKGWAKSPFSGLKLVFPQTKAIVCITDDGGSTGELLKDLPIIALGDIRHVLLSSIQLEKLQKQYGLTITESLQLVNELSTLFNYRYTHKPNSADSLLKKSGVNLECLPESMRNWIQAAIMFCYTDERCRKTLKRAHCVGNLIVLSAICQATSDWHQLFEKPFEISDENAENMYRGLAECVDLFGAQKDAVLPCTITPAQLRFRYTNGVQVRGENKSSEAQRGYPVDRVFVDFCGKPYISAKVFQYIQEADVLIMAPGSLYSSLIPVLQVPGIADAVRKNEHALKLLICNLWVQAGETDKSISDPERKFQVSDMIRAYDRNLPGGTSGLFDQILCLSLKDVPGSIIQNYAVEGKMPIYLDRDLIKNRGLEPIECGFFSKSALQQRQVIQHDPRIVAQTVKTLYLAKHFVIDEPPVDINPHAKDARYLESQLINVPSHDYKKIQDRIANMPVTIDGEQSSHLNEEDIREVIVTILWSHQDIPLTHLHTISGLTCVREEEWSRDQRWDNVFSFYDPEDGQVKIRQDRFGDYKNLEVAFLIAVGQSLLGNYAAEKTVEAISHEDFIPGRIFHLILTKKTSRICYFTDSELQSYLILARMIPKSGRHFTRLINGIEGFTPPGLLMGIIYAWYLDNRLASHIEYKMSVLKIRQTDLIPEQMKTRDRRESLISFFREIVFRKGSTLM